MITDLNKEIEILADEFASQRIPQEQSLLSAEAYQSKIREEFKETIRMREVGESLSHAIFFTIKQGRDYMDAESVQQLVDEFEGAFDRLMKMDEKVDMNKTFQELTHISNKTMDGVEKMAIQKYQEKDFLLSSRLFVLLSILNPRYFPYWLGLGIDYQEMGNFKGALNAYSKALNLDNFHVVTHLFKAECHYQMNEKQEALQECEFLKTITESEPIEIKWKNYLADLEELINKI